MVNKRFLLQRYGISVNRINRKLNSTKKATRNKKKVMKKKVSRTARNMSYWVRGKKA